MNGSEGEETESKKKKPRLEESNNVLLPKRKKVSSPSIDNGGEASSVLSKKPRPSVKELLQQKREQERTGPETGENPTKNHNNNVPVIPNVAGPITPSGTVKELLQLKRDKEKDVVDLSVNSKVPVETNTTESSSDSSDSSSESSESESGDEDEEGKDGDAVKGENDPDAKLPNNLTAPTLTAIEDIKKAAATSDQQGKCRFFSPEINRLLLA